MSLFKALLISSLLLAIKLLCLYCGNMYFLSHWKSGRVNIDRMFSKNNLNFLQIANKLLDTRNLLFCKLQINYVWHQKSAPKQTCTAPKHCSCSLSCFEKSSLLPSLNHFPYLWVVSHDWWCWNITDAYFLFVWSLVVFSFSAVML